MKWPWYQSYQQALAIYRALKDRRGELSALESFPAMFLWIFNSIDGDYGTRAIKDYEQALVIARELQDREAEGRILESLGLAYGVLGNYRKAIEYHEQQLMIARELQEQDSEGYALGALGDAYLALRDYARAITHYEQWLIITRKLQNSFNEPDALDGLGRAYAARGDYTKAIEYHQKHLEIIENLEKKTPEAKGYLGMDAFRGIGYALEKENQPELAIVFYKRAVSIVESSRRELRKNFQNWEQSEFKPSEYDRAFNRWGQESIPREHAPMYRRLADLLLQQNRVIEAMQVLDLLKVQDLQDFAKNVKGNATPATGIELLPQETFILQTLNASAQQSFSDLLKVPTIQAQVQMLQGTATDQNLKLNTYQDLQARRQKLGENVALFYPLVLDDRLELVILTKDRPPIRKSVAITQKQLEKEIQDFRRQLQERSPLIEQPAQQLYQRLMQPIEADLKAAGVDTLVYAPDSIMRYVPLAALHDGKQWLAQRYKINYLTALALTPLDPDRNVNPRVLAGALTKPAQVTVLGKTHTFRALQFTQPEVENLANLLPNTTTLIDQTFSRTRLSQGIPQSTILHLATHGMFVPGSPDQSIILLGDGSTISLREIEQQWKFPNVSLVVLSACETAIGGKLGSGIEIMGFGYQMQRTGSRASLSSLWTVDDGGTQVLMNAFYSGLKQGMPKAEALQQAQIALINGDFTAGGKLRGNFIITMPPGQTPISTNLKHPFYWAPFILIGNGL